MTLTVSVPPELLDGNSGREFFIDDGKQSILFGRSVECDIKLAEHLTSLGRKHFEIRQAAGGYELVTDHEHPVYLEGEREVGTLALKFPLELTLINAKEGPRISLRHTKTLGGAVTDKDALKPGVTVQGKIRNLKAIVRATMAAGAIAAMVFGGYSYWETQQRKAGEVAMLARTNTLLEEIGRVEKASLAEWSDVFKRAQPSVYQIAVLPADGGDPQPKGTAWVHDDHRLATNAHVAKLFSGLGHNQQLVAISSDGTRLQIPIKSVQLHPAYLKFRQTISEIDMRNLQLMADNCTDGRVGAVAQLGSYDVALLDVGEPGKLAKPLKISENASVLVGMDIAYIGYPEEFAKLKSQHHFKTGVVSGTSDFLGVSRNGVSDLIYHSAPASGGASGSPIFNRNGEVVAVLSGGEMLTSSVGCVAGASATKQGGPPRQVSGSGTFYSQNVRLIADIDHGLTATELVDLQKSWINASLYNSRSSEVWAVVAAWKDIANPPEIDSPEVAADGVLRTDPATRSSNGSFVTTEDLDAGTYVAFGVGADGENLALQVRSADGQLETPIYMDEKPVAIFDLPQSGPVTFAMLGTPEKKAALRVLKLSD